MIGLLLAAVLSQALVCRGEAAAAVAEGDRLAEELAIDAAVDHYDRAATLGCADARIATVYARAWQAAKEAARRGGDAASVAPVRDAVATLAERAGNRPGIAEITRLVLTAAIAAAQSERDEMALYLEQAVQLERLQLLAGEPPAPVVTAHEAAGELWLQVHRYEDARRAYTRAAEQLGTTPRVTVGLARVASRLKDAETACAEYRTLVAWWGSRAESPEILEARGYLSDRCR